jgi:hypothetical protein
MPTGTIGARVVAGDGPEPLGLESWIGMGRESLGLESLESRLGLGWLMAWLCQLGLAATYPRLFG